MTEPTSPANPGSQSAAGVPGATPLAAMVGIRVDVAVLALRPRAQLQRSSTGQPGLHFGVFLVKDPEGRWVLPGSLMQAHEPAAVAAARAIHDVFGLLNLGIQQVCAEEVAGSRQRLFAIGYQTALNLGDAERALTSGRCSFGVVQPGGATLVVDGAIVALPAEQQTFLAQALAGVRRQYESKPDPLGLLADLITLADLKDAHDAVMGADVFSRDAFRRVMEPQMLVVGERKSGTAGRPAKVYRRIDDAAVSHPVPVSADELQAEPHMQSHTHRHADESPSESATPAKVQEQAAVPAQLTPTEPTPVPVSGAHQHSEAQFRNIADRGWLDELLSFVSASLTVAEDSEVPGHVRFTVAPACTNERATEQVMILLDKCAEIAPMSFVDLRAKRRPNRLQRADLTSAKAYAEYSRVLRMKLNQMHDLAVMAQALLDLACVAADPLLRFNTRQVLADVDVLAGILDATAETGLTTYDVSSSAGVIPDGAERDVVKGVPVLLHMSGAEAFAFRHIADALTELAEFADATVTRLSERLWWVEPE